jgi:hypothetical protein
MDTDTKRAEILSYLQGFASQLAAIDEQRETLQAERDEWIRAGLELGLSLREIGRAASLSHPRVYKVGSSVTAQTLRGTNDAPEQARD